MIETIIGIVLALIIIVILIYIYCCIRISGEITKEEDEKNGRAQ